MKYLSIKLTFVFLGIATFAGAQNVITLAGDPTGVASGSTNNATGTTARFTNPYGVVADYFGNVYVADNGNNLVRKIVVATTAVTTLAGSGVAGNNNATGTTATFNGPDGIAADGSGNLYVSDGQGHEIRKIVIASATVTTLAGSPLTTGHADGTGTAATFSRPEGLVWDGGNNLYVVDEANSNVRMIVIATGVVTTFAGSNIGTGGFTDATGTSAKFQNPVGIAFDGASNLYVADAGNNEIRKIVIATAAVTTLAGNLFGGGYTNATGTNAQFLNPTGVATNGNGTLYVADQQNNAIRQIIVSTGVVTTFANTAATQGSVNGAVATAEFNFPTGIAIDYSGHIYIADDNNNEIRKISTVGLPISLLYFDAAYLPGKNIVNLAWSTASEVNNKLFTVEKSIDGITYDKVMDVDGADNSSERRNYVGIDETPFDGVSYYRLKQTDYDGRCTYSDVVPVLIQDEAGMVIYPNPVNTTMNLLYTSSSDNTLEIKMLDISGKLMRSDSYNISRGNNSLNIELGDIPQGVYLLEIITAKGETQFKKFIKE